MKGFTLEEVIVFVGTLPRNTHHFLLVSFLFSLHLTFLSFGRVRYRWGGIPEF